MTAVTIDVSVVDGSNTKVTANPIYPIQNPLDIGELAAGVIDAPVNITELAFGYIIAPINIAELTAGVVIAPIDIAEVSAIDISVPIDITESSAIDISAPINIAELTPSTVAVPIDITELSPIDIDTPVDISEVAAGVVAVPVNIAEVAVADIAIPTDITEIAAATLAVPTVITANALDPEVPPFSLKHARILYLNKLIGSAVTTSLGTNGSLVLVPNTADRWAFTTTSFITFTLSAAVSIDTIGIGAHNLGSTNYVISFQYSTTDVSSFVTFNPAQTPADNTALMSHISSSVSARRIRIICTGSGSAFIGSIYAGIALQMQRPFFAGHSPLPLSAKTIRYSSVTEGGNFVGEQIRRLGFRSSAPFKNLSNDWYRTYFQPFVIHARTLPYFFAWNLDQYPTDVGYCKTSEDITPAYGSLDMFNVSFDMVGFG